ncbi:MAG: hypothetical protein A2X25_08405 [Chloroflexi bacterium GWB2_49_20]|nr:MAG: hypothetical protein A2X25_08405 [Chloroflexi bacterium GWB2_49_20]OGN79544.1 MAG: hypothetical protein A2X26_05620 [Chloroflexi bacterium GWC2_49_37]OGN84533.1 MAG: hypothetical protein A2X27_10910 [Chloroflexi bacterium GWD2_49_16]HBG74043.1 hypothetical protein [Anaerolineae bacterium]HCC78845.1 hypothetical protein [Anaerolineae bacterium]
MTISNTFSTALQAFQELRPEIEEQKKKAFHESSLITMPPSITVQELIAQNPSLPEDTLMLGMANDGLPVLLNLYEPAPTPLLVMGDAGSGKTCLMRTLACATDLIQDPSDIQFGVVSNNPDEWQAVDVSPGSVGVWPANHPSAGQFIQRVVDWARQPLHGRQVMILFLDDLSSLIHTSYEVQENIKWLLLNGSKNQVWIVASLNGMCAIRMRVWLDLFNTHIFGYIHQPSVARALTADSFSDFESLVPGLEFDIKQQGGWLRFWLPALKTC